MQRSVNTIRVAMLILTTIMGLFFINRNIHVAETSFAAQNDSRELVQQENPLQIHIWHGLLQKVGHLGYAQDDFNLMGNVAGY